MLKRNAVTRALHYVGGPHKAYVIGRTGNAKGLPSTTFPLGMFAEFDATVSDAGQLDAGEFLVLATDGIPETRSPSGELYGWYLLLDAIRQRMDLHPEQIVADAMSSLAEFRGGRRPLDDCTSILAKVE